ncbi:unnamed protein product [Trichobilharzia szidati]|nr:unnamed protein product [Trichobilharzia szidati]
MTVLKHKAMNSLKSSNNNNNNECYPEQMVRTPHDHNPLSCCPSNSSVTVASTENSKHQTDCTDSQPVVVVDNEDDNDEGTAKRMKNQRKSLETFDFLKMPDIYEQNVNAARRLKSEVSYAKYKRKCQLRLLILMNSLFSGAYGKADFIQNATESSSDNQLHKSSEYIFQKLFGPLSKYLRLTKQHTYHNRNMILNRLKIYLQYNMSAEAFLSIYFNPPNEFISLHYCHLSSSITHKTCSQTDKHKIATNNIHSWKCWRRESQASGESKLNKASLNKSNINSDSDRQIFQTWKLRLCDPLRNASVYDGFRFELIRSNVKLFCCVKQCTLFELIQASLPPAASWWSFGFQYEYNHNNHILLPSSTVETCIGSSENTAEIKL